MDELENLLRQFQPRRPRALPGAEPLRRRRAAAWIALSGIGAMVVLMVSWGEPISVSDAPASAVTLGALTPYAINEASDLESILRQTSRVILPDVERSSGALRGLAQE